MTPMGTNYRQQGLIVEAHGPFVDVWRESGRPVSPQIAEDVGEDHGFYSPVSVLLPDGRWRVTEGFDGELCDHKWGMVVHYGRDPYGTISTCAKCGVKAGAEFRRRSTKGVYSYDVWELRPHIYGAWCRRGPVPGSLQPQAHHKAEAQHGR